MALRWIDRLVPHQLTRDVAMLFRSLGSDKPAPFATRGVNAARSSSEPAHQERPSFYDLDPSFDTFDSPSSTGSFASSANDPASSAKASSYTRRLRVSEVRRETADAISLVLVDPTGELIAFEAGQFFTIAHHVDGRVVKRAYSASSSALDASSVSITIKRVEGGLVSNSINDSMVAGHHLEVLGPSGSFVVPSHATDLVLVGGGSGITPLMSIAKTTLASRADARVTLIFGNRSPDDVIFARDIEALSEAHGARFVVRHVVEVVGPEHGASAFRVGRLDEATLASELQEAALRSEAHFFVCGPAVVMDAAERVLRERGVDAARVRSERFSSLRAAAHADVPEEVTVFMEGRRFSLTVPPSETILEAAMRTSLPMPFSCTVGGCGACRVRLLAGDVALDEPNCLDAEERRQGYVLACVSRPLGPVTLEVE